MKRLIATLVGAAVMVPAVAWACGGGDSGGGDSGGGDSGGGDSGGDSSSSSSDSGSSSSSTPACVDTSDVHGHRACSDFGAWKAPRSAVAIELGLVMSAIDISGLSASGQIDHGDGGMYTYRVVGEDLGGRVAARGLALRTLIHGRTWYGGIESSFALLDAEERSQTMEPRTTLTTRVLGSSTSMLVVGNRLWVDRITQGVLPAPVSLAAEMAGGVRLTSVEAESQTGVCTTTDRTMHGAAVVEARLRADWWLSPSVSVGAWSGVDVIAQTPSVGLMFASHLRAFDGTR